MKIPFFVFFKKKGMIPAQSLVSMDWPTVESNGKWTLYVNASLSEKRAFFEIHPIAFSLPLFIYPTSKRETQSPNKSYK